MEKMEFFGEPVVWQSSEAPPVKESSDQLPQCFLNLNWDRSMEQTVQFESAFSSIVSSPSDPAPPAENIVIRELIGRLGSICNSGEISPQSHHHYINSTSNSCYSTPLNSPPKLNLSIADRRRHPQPGGNFQPPATHLAQFSADPGFAERAARFSCFGGRNYGGLSGEFVSPESGELSRVSSSHSLKAGGSQLGVSQKNDITFQDGSQLEMENRPNQFNSRLSGSSTPEDAEFRDESSASDQIATVGEVAIRGLGESNSRKRKAAPRAKAKNLSAYPSAKDPQKMMADEDLKGKRSKSAESGGIGMDEVMPKVEQNGDKHGKENNSKPPEPPKQDYIHVRARRGQATDSHSLAERVRREKISERMKFLQDLVPGCNKVTGKAVMLDEIINYVQSLQRQVEFLSMKLATVNPRLDINMESLLQKDMHQSREHLPHSVYLENPAVAFPFAHQPQQGTPLQSIITNGLETHGGSANPLDTTLRRTLSMHLPSMDGFGGDASQLATFWEDDLQSVVEMGFGKNQEATFSSQNFHGPTLANHMKIEL